jgi:ankyrin repeat protein
MSDSPLFIAVKERDVDKVQKLLLKKDCKVNSLNGYYDESPLHLACATGNVEIVKLLLEHKDIDVNLRDIRGDLMNVMKVLNDNEGWTPMTLAKANGFMEIEDLLLKAGAAPEETRVVRPKQVKIPFTVLPSDPQVCL